MCLLPQLLQMKTQEEEITEGRMERQSEDLMIRHNASSKWMSVQHSTGALNLSAGSSSQCSQLPGSKAAPAERW